MPDAQPPFLFSNEIYPADWFTVLNLEKEFGNDHPVELDLGCGDGLFLVSMARKFPDRNFLGVERLLGRVRKVCRRVDRLGLPNIRLLRIDSNYAVRSLLPPGSLHRIHFLCPDPWPKKKHARRRQMCQLDFLRNLHSLLEPGGELLFKTDSAAYFAEACERLPTRDLFREIEWPDQEEGGFFYPGTDFEEQWLKEGRSIRRLRLRKI